MARAVWIGIRLLVLMIVAVVLSNHPGKVSIVWENYLIETSIGVLLLIIILVLGFIFLLNRLRRDILHVPEHVSRYREAQIGKRGRRALTRGLVAVASGDAKEAKRLARQTEAGVVDPVLSHLLTAEALILSGDNDAAESQFEMLLGREDTVVIGYRGLIEVALAKGNWAKALTRAREARTVMARSPWLFTLLVDLEARAGDWDAAQHALDQANRGGQNSLNENDIKRRQLALLTTRAEQAAQEDDPEKALTLCEKALAIHKGFVPASLLAARLYQKLGKQKNAEKTIEQAWALSPEPPLIKAWAELAPANDPVARVRWMEQLKIVHPQNREASLAYAASLIEAQQFAFARRDLEALLALDPTQPQTLMLMAKLTRAETKNDAAAFPFLERAQAAAIEEWICTSCGKTHVHWASLCHNCGAFARIVPAGDSGMADPNLTPPPPLKSIVLPGIGASALADAD